MMLIKVCPRCGSEDVVWIIPQNWSMWECNNCSYTGAVIEVEKNVQKDIQKKWKNHKNEHVKESVFDESDELSEEEFEEKIEKLFDEK